MPLIWRVSNYCLPTLTWSFSILMVAVSSMKQFRSHPYDKSKTQMAHPHYNGCVHPAVSHCIPNYLSQNLSSNCFVRSNAVTTGSPNLQTFLQSIRCWTVVIPEICNSLYCAALAIIHCKDLNKFVTYRRGHFTMSYQNNNSYKSQMNRPDRDSHHSNLDSLTGGADRT